MGHFCVRIVFKLNLKQKNTRTEKSDFLSQNFPTFLFTEIDVGRQVFEKIVDPFHEKVSAFLSCPWDADQLAI